MTLYRSVKHIKGDKEKYGAKTEIVHEEEFITDEGAWNPIGLTENISSNNATLANYSYLSDGMKTSARHSDGSGLVYRGPFLYGRDAGGTLTFGSAAFAGGRITATGVQYHVTDHLGSVVAVVKGSDGSVVESGEYAAYGRRTDIVPAGTPTAATNRWHFSGKEDQGVDFDIPYTDFGARLYAPNLGRWITPDPESEKYYDFSPYAYCANDPVNMVDPDGKCWEILLGMVVEYGFQVYDNYKEGDTGYNLWLGNVDLAEVGLSAINPTKKGKLVFTLLVEVGKEVISYSLKEGVSFNDDIEEVIKNATVNTVVDRAVGAFFKQGSKKAAETAKREAREASIKTGRAQRKAARRPNSTKAAREAKDAVINEKNARKREVTTRSINAVKVFEGSTATTIQHLNNYEEEQEEK